MKLDSYPVLETHPRPAGPANACFYCDQLIGTEHAANCVMRHRSIIIRMTIEYPITMPESWSEDQIYFNRNKGSWCANNALNELEELFEKVGRTCCMCGIAKFEYVREATPEETVQAKIDLQSP